MTGARRELQTCPLAEGPWNGPPEKVTVLYAKGESAPADVPEYHGARETPWEPGGTILQGYIPVMTDSEPVP